MNSHEMIYQKATKLIEKYKTRDPVEIIEALHIMIAPTDTNKLLGMYTIFQRKRIILISERAGKLKNTVLAHELGHDQLHRNECHARKAFTENSLLFSNGRCELEANVFAAHLLIGNEEIKSLLNDGYTIQEIACTLGVTKELVSLKISEMNTLNLLNIENWKLYEMSSNHLKNYIPKD